MKLKTMCSLAITTLALLGATAPGWSAGSPSIVFTLAGKPVTSVPVDKLHEVTVTVNTGGQNFKQVYSGQWGNSIDQALSLFGVIHERAGAGPNPENAPNWPSYDFALSSGDSNWSGKTSLSLSMGKAAKADGLQLFKASNHDNVMMTARFYRKVYTGKTVWQDGGWVQETRWETVGNNLGQATLKLEPPTFAASLVPSQLFAKALEANNAPPENEYNNNRAMEFSRWLLYPQSYGGREVKFDGSKITAFDSSAGTPSFNWNYEHNSGAPMVYAHFPATMKIHSVMSTKLEAMPLPSKTEADFSCPIEMTVSRMLSEGTWKGGEVDFSDASRGKCRTADGKTADDIVKAADPMSNVTTPQDLLKNLGF